MKRHRWHLGAALFIAVLMMLTNLQQASSESPDPPAVAELQRLISPTPSREGSFASSVAVSGDFIAFGEPFEKSGSLSLGSVDIFSLNSEGAEFEQTLAFPGEPVDRAMFGLSVSLTQDWLAVGAPGADQEGPGCGGGNGEGAIFLYQRPSGSVQWSLADRVDPPRLVGYPVECPSWGMRVKLEGDRLMAIGRSYLTEFDLSSGVAVEDVSRRFIAQQRRPVVSGDIAVEQISNQGQSSVLVHRFDGSSWQEVDSLQPNDDVDPRYFGNEAAVCGDRVLVTNLVPVVDETGQHQYLDPHVSIYTVGDDGAATETAYLVASELGIENGVASLNCDLLQTGDIVISNPISSYQLDITSGHINAEYLIRASRPIHTMAAATDDFVVFRRSDGTDTLVRQGMASLFERARRPTVDSCGDLPATIVGTDGPDQIVGTGGDDVIVALDGDDVVDGGGGSDVICLGRGRDEASGGPGDDIIYGGRGADTIEGNGGDDIVYGGRGADTIEGNGGDDIIYAGRGADVVRGGGGDDDIRGGRGDDELRGQSGKDVVRGNRGEDQLFGGSGEDILRGGRNDDVLTGGAGNDKLTGGRGSDDIANGSGGEADVCDAETETNCELDPAPEPDPNGSRDIRDLPDLPGEIATYRAVRGNPICLTPDQQSSPYVCVNDTADGPIPQTVATMTPDPEWDMLSDECWTHGESLHCVDPGSNTFAEIPLYGFDGIVSQVVISATSQETGAVDDWTVCISDQSASAVWCRGQNDVGQLGNGTTEASNVFTPVLLPEGVAGLSDVSGTDRTFCSRARAAEGVVCWGDNTFGQLGDDTVGGFSATAVAVQMPELGQGDAVTALAISGDTSCFTTEEARIFCSGLHTGTGVENGDQEPQPIPVETGTEPEFANTGGAIDITASSDHVCVRTILTSQVFCWGDDSNSQVSGEDRASDSIRTRPVSMPTDSLDDNEIDWVKAGEGYTVVGQLGGSAWIFGSTKPLGEAPTPAGEPFPPIEPEPPALTDRGFPQPIDGSDWDVLFGDTHTCGTTTAGNVYCVSSTSENGTLDPTFIVPNDIPVEPIVEGDGRCVLTDIGQVHCPRAPGAGGNDVVIRFEASDLDPEVGAVANLGAPVRGNNVCLINTDGELFCHGPNFAGQLGNGTIGGESDGFDFVPHPASRAWIDVDVSFRHACAIDDNNITYCWGNDQYGESSGSGQYQFSPAPRIPTPQAVFSGFVLGDDDIVGANTEVTAIPARVFVEEYTSCVLSSQGEAVCWGGRTGVADDPDTPANARPATQINDLGAMTGEPIVQISTGYYHTCAATETSVFCWGANWTGQLGAGDASIQPRLTIDRDVGVDDRVLVGYGHSLLITNDAETNRIVGNTSGYFA